MVFGWFSSGICTDRKESEAALVLLKSMICPSLVSFFRLRFLGEFGLTGTKTSLLCFILENRTRADAFCSQFVHLCINQSSAQQSHRDHMTNYFIGHNLIE